MRRLDHTLFLMTLLAIVGGMDIKLRCNDYIEKVYVQDKEESGRRGWRETVKLSVSDKASIIAVQWSNVGGTTPAFIASASTGIVSDDINWKCTTTQPEGNWYEEHFDSRGWDNAALVCRNDNCGSHSDSNFPGNASWIRSTGGSLAEHTYCRGQLGPVSLTVVYPRSDVSYLYTDGVELLKKQKQPATVFKEELTRTPQLIAVRNRRWNFTPGWTIVSMSNGFVSGENWVCQEWYRGVLYNTCPNLDRDDTSWVSAVVVQRITTNYKVIDNNAKIWWTANNTGISNEQDCFCRGIVGVSAYVNCNDRGHVYVDGEKMNKNQINDEWRSIIPRTARLIAIKAGGSGGRRFVRATFSNDFQTSEKWKCLTTHYDNWYTIHFEDSTDDWKNALIKPIDSGDYIWEESDKNGIIYCRGWIECGCGDNFRCIPSLDGYNYKCVCREGYSGETCEDTAVKCSDRPADCGDHGQCVDIDDFYVCLCEDGYAGENCEADINECASNPCQHGTTCSNSVGRFHCDCADSGYEGKICEEEINECRSDPCQNGGKCRDGFKSYTCDCTNTGFGDLTCSTEIDECESNPCQHNGQCLDEINNFNCSCTGTGYVGPTCSSDVNECLKKLPQCVKDTCVNSQGSYSCTCVSGYTGLRCETDIDECADSKLNNCTTKCSNHPGGYTCGCDDGYELQGQHDCADIDECDRKSDNCAHRCTNTVGSFACSCKDGFELMTDGHACQEIKQGSSSVGVAAGVSALLVLIAAVVALIIFYRWRKRQRTKDNDTSHRQSNFSNHKETNPAVSADIATGHEYENVKELRKQTDKKGDDVDVGQQPKQSSSTPDAANKTDHSKVVNEEPVYSNIGVEAQVSRPIPVDDLSVYVKTKLDRGGFKTEFESIPKRKLKECSAAERDGIRPKLRFTNILPYDFNRVVLSKIPGQALSDFVNASYVYVYRDNKYYIATQGPKKKILDEFWRMVWEQNVSLIVMVTNLVEAGVPKCDRYWPEGSTDTYNEFTVTIKEKQEVLHFTFQTFSLEKDGESRQVKQCHFKSWPDKGVPGTGSSLLEFRRQIKKIEKDFPPPIVVHCSAGVGRTGTYIALDYLLQQAEAEGVVDVCGCVNFLRESRMHMVQTLDQYTFLHSVLLEALTVGVTAIPCSKFTQKYGILKKAHPTTKTSKLQDQFKLLEELMPSYDQSNYSESLDEGSNAAKNRDATILPVNQYRPCLRTKQDAPSDYINAVFVDGYHSRREFMVTQMPLEKTVVDVWRLVADFGIRTIVQLQGEADESYFPEDSDATLDTGLFSIKSLSTKTEDQITVRALLVSGSDLQEDIKVNHISVTSWPNHDALPKEPGHLLAAFRIMQRQQRQQQQGRTTSPILIVCLNGLERSGLFCAMCIMMDEINGQQEVDIFRSVRDIRQSRPQFIPTQEQYNYLHEVARTYLARLKS